jgi:DNA-binding NarL/FixJ family response regulator
MQTWIPITSLDIYLVEDSAILRDRLVESLASWGGTRIVGQADTEAAANVGLKTHDWDVLILDFTVASRDRAGVLTNLAAHRRPGTVVIVVDEFRHTPLTAHEAWNSAPIIFSTTANEFSKIRDVLGEISKRKEVHH